MTGARGTAVSVVVLAACAWVATATAAPEGRIRGVAVTTSLVALARPMATLRVEVPLEPMLSMHLGLGVGNRSGEALQPLTDLEMAGQIRWYPSGRTDRGLFTGASLRQLWTWGEQPYVLGTIRGSFSSQRLHGLVGFKWTASGGTVFEVLIGAGGDRSAITLEHSHRTTEDTVWRQSMHLDLAIGYAP